MSVSGATITLTKNDGTTVSQTINNVANAANSTNATNATNLVGNISVATPVDDNSKFSGTPNQGIGTWFSNFMAKINGLFSRVGTNETNISNKLDKSGGTMTGGLTLDDGASHNSTNFSVGGNIYVNTGSSGNPANQQVLIVENDDYSWRGKIRPTGASSNTAGVLAVAADGTTSITTIPAIPTGANLSSQAATAGQTARDGTAATFARSDHYHALPAAPTVPTGANISTAALSTTVTQGTATTFARSDHAHAIPAIPSGTNQRTNLGYTSDDRNSISATEIGVTGTLSISNGGTGTNNNNISVIDYATAGGAGSEIASSYWDNPQYNAIRINIWSHTSYQIADFVNGSYAANFANSRIKGTVIVFERYNRSAQFNLSVNGLQMLRYFNLSGAFVTSLSSAVNVSTRTQGSVNASVYAGSNGTWVYTIVGVRPFGGNARSVMVEICVMW